ncbi:hypothetical protein F0562_002498 [Nyssa sinensis]|uniref:ENT domain-containing protein n=1 Tax=Nyssa sinensis TaxID=561372 RepID=A0A5J5C7I2_9ASTE|nr:hypothetical protein F0562_002498 [Nyssa sinensis]
MKHKQNKTKLRPILLKPSLLLFPSNPRFKLKKSAIMVFKEWDLVEVLRRENDLCGSWFSGKIIAIDGDGSYIVRYELLVDHKGEPLLEKVLGEYVRPQPPNGMGKRWMVGNIAEVFDVPCWRVGKVVKVLNNDYFIIKLFGSIQLKEFHQSNLRIRQAWNGSTWSMIEKISPNKENNLCYSIYSQSFVRRGSTTDDISSLKARLGEKCMNGSTKMDVKTDKTANYPLNSSSGLVWSSEGSNHCSVASSSFIEFPEYYPNQYSLKSSRNIFGSSDTELSFSSSSGQKHLSPSPEDNIEVDIHKLELRAYQSTVQAFYALGPLSWEQESLLTNLRLSLHISNEEHLLQLRHLLSTQVQR